MAYIWSKKNAKNPKVFVNEFTKLEYSVNLDFFKKRIKEKGLVRIGR